MTETELLFYIAAGVVGLLFVSGLGGYILAKLHIRRAKKLEANFMESYERHEDASHPDLATYTYANKPEESPLTAPPASESSKKVDWDPDNYKPLSEGDYVKISQTCEENNFKRFDQDELDELGQLTSHQKFHIGG